MARLDLKHRLALYRLALYQLPLYQLPQNQRVKSTTWSLPVCVRHSRPA